MFKKLKLKFILTNIITSTAIIVVAFSSIYLVAKNTEARPKGPRPPEFDQVIEERLSEQRTASLNSLLYSLIITGIAMELIITVFSIYLAEQAIKPVREAYSAQKAFITNASHEIKTPLAVIQANLEASEIKDNKWIDIALKKTDDLTKFTNQLLLLARTDRPDIKITKTEFNLNQLISDNLAALEPRTKAHNLSIKFERANKPLTLKTNRQALEQILNIYLDNAIKYGKKNIIIETAKSSISVMSDGDLISEEKLPHLFERFYQSDKTSEGVGLGLSIAKSIANKNKWKVEAKIDQKRNLNVFTLQFK